MAKRKTQSKGGFELAKDVMFIDFSLSNETCFANDAGEVIVQFGVKKPTADYLMPKAEIRARRIRKLLSKKFKKPSSPPTESINELTKP